MSLPLEALGRDVLEAVLVRAAEEGTSEILRMVFDRLGPDVVRRELDAYEVARRLADEAERRKFGKE